MKIDQNQNISNRRRLIINQNSIQYLKLLQMPLIEIHRYLLEESEKNPILEVEVQQNSNYIEKSSNFDIEEKISIYSHLEKQVRETFYDKIDLKIAGYIIGNLDENGFFSIDTNIACNELAIDIKRFKSVLKKINFLDPIGIATKDLQESLLIQLEDKNKKDSFAYYIIKWFYSYLLSNKVIKITKLLKRSKEEIEKIFKSDISTLNFSLLESFQKECNFPVSADILVKQEKDQIIVKYLKNHLPIVSFNRKYLKHYLITKNVEEKEFIEKYYLAGKNLLNNIIDRNKLLLKLVTYVVKKQQNHLFFDKKLSNLTEREIAKYLKTSISTVSRLISNKYIETPRGILPVKKFLTSNSKNSYILQKLKQIVKEENKEYALTDDMIAKKLKNMGITCSRRSIANYRKKLHFENSFFRKESKS
jgi:RNA polymerase sigma-54 factor